MRQFISQTTAAEELSPILPGIQWALMTGIDGALSQYDPATGHNAWVLGSLAYNQIFDRFDRVFSTGRYLIPSGATDDVPRADVLEGLPESAANLMPTIPPGDVQREYINQVPGFRFGPYSLLTQSSGSHSLDDFVWSSLRKKTKHEIACLSYCDSKEESGQLSLELGEDSLPSSSFVIVCYRVSTSGYTAGYGLPRDNSHGGSPWHWFTELPPLESKAKSISLDQPERISPRINKNVSLKRQQYGVQQG
ncbi:hypothetical protein [Corynebacterium sp. HMSC075D04]|uniref:hypothetical protein n=1 Tax=Corynebacterium sp. HMSC075D04 TaxID=1739540 RepID=UPI00114C8BEE|nr:hypothetical protein [Corynebacterium sp. HMSC075D04]